jgi:ribosomal protein S18 acetylase RimI-like enzyme
MEEVITTYIEMTDYAQFRPAYIVDSDLTIMPMGVPLPAFYLFLYGTVGRDYQWIDRLKWTDEELLEYLSSPSVTVWVAYYKGTPAGYIELQRQAKEPGIQVAYFGLIPLFHGRGLGKHLLSFGVQKAWDENPARVWLDTCTLDGPYALPNYQKRGFSIYKQVVNGRTGNFDLSNL